MGATAVATPWHGSGSRTEPAVTTTACSSDNPFCSKSCAAGECTCGKIRAMREQPLPLKNRPVDIFFIVMFAIFTLTSGIADLIPTIGIEMSETSSSFLARANYGYAHDTDPLFLNTRDHPSPVWMRFVTGLSAFVYPVFYVFFIISAVKGWNRIQVPAVMYATAISVITGVVVFGVEFFGEPEWRVQNVPMFLSLNLPYVLVPILLLIRMRKEKPFNRRF